MPELILDVEKMIWRGRSLGRLPSGQVVIVDPGSFPGEKIRARVTRRKKDYLLAECCEVLEPLAQRRPHPCKYGNLCGGCRFGVVPNRYQLNLKQVLLKDELKRALADLIRTEALEEIKIYPAQPSWRYRWRGHIHVSQSRPHQKSFQSSQDVPIEDCLLMAPVLGAALKDIAKRLPDGRHTVAASPGDQSVYCEADQGKIALPFPQFGLVIHVPSGVFFQANWKLNQTLVNHVCQWASDYHRVVDLYSGSGNFALPLATQVSKVLALDSDPRAIQAAAQSAREFGLSNLRLARMNLSQSKCRKEISAFSPQVAVLDPPRSGAGKSLIHLDSIKSMQRMIWVSCDIVNTCRDLKAFLQSGWFIREIALMDMFPQTWHMETVIVLEKRNKKRVS